MSEQSPQLPPLATVWSEPSHYRRDKYGIATEVNSLYAGVDSPINPNFPEDAGINRQRYGLDEETQPSANEREIYTADAVASHHADMEVPKFETKESESDKRLKAVFAPHKYLFDSAKAEEVVPTNYDYLFTGDESFQQAMAKHEIERDRFGNKLQEWQPTKETREKSKDTLIQVATHDEGLRKLIESQSEHINLNDPYAVVDAIRTKPDFRLAVGKYYLHKITELSREPGVMPERIVSNRGKRPDKGGYAFNSLTSREYASLLCLAMLDGTFDSSVISSVDYIEHNQKGETIAGQHRMAAHTALGA